ncbi:MAG: NADH-quinone oxidoreductase subunit H [Polyangiaceae bacterium]|nr:NADH-quinone oxidoreductase subunit H [Polyangiaceae bacterium]MCB9606955.1 NADH-quinone oxidoreductase subunit H [Polyangiaceae bacterium]
MTFGTLFLLSLAKAFTVVVALSLNIAGLLTWVDRRQGAILQDRVGPERAVVWIPKRIAQGAVVGPAVLVAGGALALFFLSDAEGVTRTTRAVLFSHLAVFITWFTALVIAGRIKLRGVKNSFDRFIASVGDPRRIFYVGLMVHGAIFLSLGVLKGTPAGETLRDFLYGAGPFVFAFSALFGAGYAAQRFRHERAGFRLIGLLHPAADGLKTIFKEDFIPPGGDQFLHKLAPFVSFFPVLVLLGVVPFGDTLCFGSDEQGKIMLSKLLATVPRDGICPTSTLDAGSAVHAVRLQVLDFNVGILYFFAMAGTGVVGAALAGWASNNKYSLLGGLRAASQMISYEVTLGLTLVGSLMIYGTVRIDEMVRWQAENTWGIFVQPLAFFLFFAAAIAETKRIPFDIPEGESEIVAGYFTEYSGMKFAMFFFSEYVAVVTLAALTTAVFLGGWHLPFLERDGLHIMLGDKEIYAQPLSHGAIILIGVLAFVGKTVGLCILQLFIRWTLPRFRYDQLMKLGWRKILPASLVNVLATGLIILAIQSGGPAVQSLMAGAAQVTQWVIAVGGLVLTVWFVRFLLKPAEHRRVLASSSAQYAASMGGTRTARMGA